MTLAHAKLLAVSAAVAGLSCIFGFQFSTGQSRWFSSDSSTRLESGEVSDHGIACVGYVEPATQVRALAFEATGVIESCSVQVGQHVSESDVLMTLNGSEARQALAVAERELDLARARKDQILKGAHVREITAAEHRLNSADLRLQRLEEDFHRSKQLLTKGARVISNHQEIETQFHIAEQEKLEAQARLLALKESVREEDRVLADAEVALAESRVSQARERLEQTVLKAPCEGTVLEILKHPGESNVTATQEPVLLFADLSRLRVRAEVDELHVHDLKVGQKAKISGPNLGGESVFGRLVKLKQIMGPKTLFVRDSGERKDVDVLEVWIEIPEGVSLPVGLRVDITILREQVEELEPESLSSI